jgi:predicted nucleotidyltransferase
LRVVMESSELKQQIVSTFKAFNPERIILFGSRARRDWDEESDFDLIVVYHTAKPFLDRLRELYLSWNIPKGVDILAYTPQEFERMVGENSFVRDAVAEGEVLYERV